MKLLTVLTVLFLFVGCGSDDVKAIITVEDNNPNSSSSGSSNFPPSIPTQYAK